MSVHGPVTFDTVCELARDLPGVEIGTAYGTPALRVRKKVMARLREDGETLAIRMEFGDREFHLQTNPEVFYITDHYAGYPMILVRLAKVDREELRELVHGAWRMIAPKRLRDQAPQI
jgi:hypothetical protein